MTEIKIRFDLTFNRRFISRALAAAILLGAVPELESESVTLSTYYPAPSGVYTQMITTGNTYLARDGGGVAINNTALVANSKLTVTGGSIAGNYGLTPQYANWSSYGTGDGGAAIYNSNEAAYRALMLVGNNSGGGVRRVKVWDELTVNGDSIVTGNSTISGSETVSANLSVGGRVDTPIVRANYSAGFPGTGVSQAGQQCGGIQQYTYASAFGGTQALCPGQYVTNVEGVYVHRYNMPPSDSANGSYICCPCPTPGCNL